MEYKRYDNYLAIRLDKNEEIIASLNKIINDEGINEPYIQLHMACADNNGNVVGGHLKSSIISATLEMFITIIDKNINRKYDLATGLNLMEFDK